MFSLRCSRKHNRCAYKLFLQLCRIIPVVHLQLWQGDHDTPETECAAAAHDRLIHVHNQLCFLVVDLSNPLCWIIPRYQSYSSNALLASYGWAPRPVPEVMWSPPRPQPTTRGPQRDQRRLSRIGSGTPNVGLSDPTQSPPGSLGLPQPLTGWGGGPQSPQDQPTPRLVSCFGLLHLDHLDLTHICNDHISAKNIFMLAEPCL